MAPRISLLDLARAVSNELASDHPSAGVRSIGLMLVDQPGACDDILDLLIAAVRKKRPDKHAIDGLLHLLGAILNEARMRAERGSTESLLVAEFRNRLKEAAAEGEFDSKLLMAIAQQFAAARLDVGDDLRASVMALAGSSDAKDAPELGPADIAAMISEVASDLGTDPFLIHAQLAETFAVFPSEPRAKLIDALVLVDTPAIRDATMGWLLDPDRTIARATAASLKTAAERGLVSGRGARRLTMLRNWVADEVRDAIDAIRPADSAAPVAQALQEVTVLASGCDGAGAQTFIILGKQGRKYLVASVLIKQGFGIRDTVVQGGLSKRAAEDMLGVIGEELDPFEASLDTVRASLEHALTLNAAEGTPPSFGLVAVLEALGWGPLHGVASPPDVLLRRLLADVPAERTSAAAVTRALAASAAWPKRLSIAQSWFEDVDGDVPGLAGTRTKKLKKAIVVAQVLSPHRARWAEVLAWTAAAAKDQAPGEDAIDMALVARECLSERPLAEIPIVDWIAQNTLEALLGR